MPYGIAAGPDGNLWFTKYNANSIGRITPGGTVTEYPIHTSSSRPRFMAAGPDGNLWFAEYGGNGIGRITSGVSLEGWAPVLAGSGQVGLPLICDANRWGPTAAVTTAWQRDGTTIGGQTGLAYTPTNGDLGAQITCTSSARLPGMLTALTVTSNSITVVAQLAGPPGPPGPAGPPGQNARTTLAAVWAPGSKTAKAGTTLKVQYAVTNAAALQAQLKGTKTLTKQVNAKAGNNTLKWKLPKNLKAGKYTLRLLCQGTIKASTKVKVSR